MAFDTTRLIAQIKLKGAIAEARVGKIKKDLEAMFSTRIQGAPKDLFTPLL